MKLGYIYAGKVIGDMNLGTDPYSGLPASLTIEGDLTVEGDFTFGNAVADTMILKGRVATGTLAGEELDLDDTYIYSQLIEIRVGITDWSNIGGSFTGRYERYMASADAAGMVLRGSEMYLTNADTFDIAYMLGTLVNLMGKGNSTITLMRGAEIKLEWLATDTVTDATGLRIDIAGLVAPSNTIYGLRFEQTSGVAATYDLIQEIRMKWGMTILSRATSPNGDITAPIGSLCLVSSGTTTNDSLFINRDGATNWKYITVEA